MQIVVFYDAARLFIAMKRQHIKASQKSAKAATTTPSTEAEETTTAAAAAAAAAAEPRKGASHKPKAKAE